MVRAWRMSDTVTDQRRECYSDPPSEVSLDELNTLGVIYIYIPETERSKAVEKVCSDRGYSFKDEITISRDRLPDYENKIKTFFDEHLHSDEEVRYVIEGSGYFDVRDHNDKWIRIAVDPGDLLILPAGIYHRFTVDTKDYIHAVRLFKGVPVWTPYNRCEAVDDMDVRREYLNTLTLSH
ncbi:hypothetical protein AB6A40_008761 [Gnathostoma spinigerum]|uniref:Acireductone dioxygenase n=1 Tax=Gnathostoma spinigerum TaxID=75299 RepID=A0ABD6EZ89_9BILA